jgi:hypothetical protein
VINCPRKIQIFVIIRAIEIYYWHPLENIWTIMNFFPPANEEDRDSLLGVYRNSINDTEQTEKDLKRWRLFAFGSGLIAVTLLVVAATSSTSTKVLHSKQEVKTTTASHSFSTTYRKGSMKRVEYSTLEEDEKKVLFENFKKEYARSVSYFIFLLLFS